MRSHYLELNVDSLMKDKKLEANLSMVASRVMAGLNMNGLKYLLPLWLGALTGVTIRCVFAAVAFWLTGCFIKEAAVTRKQRIMLFCLGAFGLYGFYVLLSAGHQQNHSGFERHIQFDAAYMGISHFRFLSARESYGNEDYRYSFGVWRCDVVYLDAGQR